MTLSLRNAKHTLYKELIESACHTNGLKPALIYAVIQVESGFNTYAWNPEPHYRWFWDVRNDRPFRPSSTIEVASKYPPKDFPCLAGDPDQEWWGQQASWGLMQMMGAVGREAGYKGPYLPGLCFPDINIALGTKFLATLIKRKNNLHGVRGGLSAYNTGSPDNADGPYVQKVEAAYLQYSNGVPL